IHPKVPQPRSDHYVYPLSGVRGHDNVVVCLPTGVYGTTTTAITVSQLMSTYQTVRLGFHVRP
ncbi:hypothetical protein ASPFODRAFT_148992, partial [Aspergillus luchuensis CBS 106.47]